METLPNNQEKPFSLEQINPDKPTFVDFWADWCNPCTILSPRLDSVVQSFGDQIDLVKVNIDQNKELSSELGIRSIPTVILYYKGEEKERIIGVQPESVYDDSIYKLEKQT